MAHLLHFGHLLTSNSVQPSPVLPILSLRCPTLLPLALQLGYKINTAPNISLPGAFALSVSFKPELFQQKDGFPVRRNVRH